jgi:hypothetical protein
MDLRRQVDAPASTNATRRPITAAQGKTGPVKL